MNKIDATHTPNGAGAKSDGASAEQQVDLVAVVLHRAGIDPRCNLMVRVAAHTLKGVSALRVDALAEFAYAEVCRQETHEMDRRRVIRLRFDRAAAIEKKQGRRTTALTSEAHPSPIAGQHFNMYRAGTLLAAGLPGLTKKDRPANAKDSQLFAALGLLLINNGLHCAHGETREALLLDAAECIYAWQNLKDEIKHREPWIQDLLATDPGEFIGSGGRVMTAKKALARFHHLYPAHVSSIDSDRTFGNEYTPIRRAAKSITKKR